MSATLLLADDSVTIQRVLELTFADEDVNVVTVNDGDAAIARLDSSPPDIVLADARMPGKSGYDVAQYMKATPRLAHIPVVLLTGAFEPVDRTRAAAAGCDDVLAKPFEPQLVITRVKELLDRRPAPVASVAPPVPRRPDLDAYFDQLDAAFANLASTPATHKTPPAPATSAPDAPEQEDVAAAPQIDDQTIAEIARRVVAHLTEDYVRKAVGEIVSATAERLVREEIERIKAGVK